MKTVKMSAEEFKSKLLKMGYPDEAGIRALSLDWVFEDPALAPFFDWFINEVTEENCLTAEELKRYEELQDSGAEIYELDELEVMEKTLGEESRSEASSSSSLSTEQLEKEVQMLEEEVKAKKQQLEMAKLVYEHMSTKCQEQLQQKKRRRRRRHTKAAAELAEAQKDAETLNANMNAAFSEAKQTLTVVQATLDEASKAAEVSAGIGGEAPVATSAHSSTTGHKYLSCMPLHRLEEESEEFNKLFDEYLAETFPEKVEEMAEVGTESQYQLLDLSNIPPDFTQMPQEQQMFYIAMNQCRTTEIRLLEHWAKNTYRRQILAAQVDTLEKIWESLQNGTFPHWSTLSSKIETNAMTSVKLQVGKTPIVWETIQQLIGEVAMTNFNVSVTGNYERKLERQNSVIRKLDEAIQILLESQAIVQFLSWALDHESHTFKHLNKMLEELEGALQEDVGGLKDRITAMEKLSVVIEEGQHRQDRGINQLAAVMDILPDTTMSCESSSDGSSDACSIMAKPLLEAICSLRESTRQECEAVQCSFKQEMQQLCQLKDGLKDLQDVLWAGCSTRHGPPMRHPPEVREAMKQLEENLNRIKLSFLSAKSSYSNKMKALSSNPELQWQRILYLDFYKKV